MDVATKRLLDGILSYLNDAPPNVSNDLLHDLKGMSDRIIETSVSEDHNSPGRMAVAEAIGKDEPDPVEFESDVVEKSPGQREAEALAAEAL
jgi:hypothetical protein